MRTYYDPEDDTCEKTDRYERLIELADHLRDEARDLLLDKDGPSPEEIAADAMCDALDAMDFAASSDAEKKPPVAMLPADADTTLLGVGVSDAAGGYTFTDTADSIRMPTEAEDAAYKAEGEEIKADALAILAKCNFMLTGYETQVCECAAGIDNGMHGVDMATFTTLRTQFSREISDHYKA
jgi:hypothetical protein